MAERKRNTEPAPEPDAPEPVEVETETNDPSLAVVPEVDEPEAKTYKVVGPHAVFGKSTGETFTRLIPPQQEAVLLSAGHLQVQED